MDPEAPSVLASVSGSLPGFPGDESSLVDMDSLADKEKTGLLPGDTIVFSYPGHEGLIRVTYLEARPDGASLLGFECWDGTAYEILVWVGDVAQVASGLTVILEVGAIGRDGGWLRLGHRCPLAGEFGNPGTIRLPRLRRSSVRRLSARQRIHAIQLG